MDHFTVTNCSNIAVTLRCIDNIYHHVVVCAVWCRGYAGRELNYCNDIYYPVFLVLYHFICYRHKHLNI